MGQQAISGIAALVVLAFIAMALAACATSAQSVRAVQPNEIAIDTHQQEASVPEFHGAHIAADTLRDRLPSES